MADLPISIGVKPFARFMLGKAPQQRRILRDYKFPDPEGRAQAKYYREAGPLLRQYHRQGRPQEWLVARGAELRASLSGRPELDNRLIHNAEAIEAYARQFPAKRIPLLRVPTFVIGFNRVRVNITPDLFWRERDRDHLMFVDFRSTPAVDGEIQTILRLALMAAERAEMIVSPATVTYRSTATGMTIKTTRGGQRLIAEFEATCSNLAAIWDSLLAA